MSKASREARKRHERIHFGKQRHIVDKTMLGYTLAARTMPAEQAAVILDEPEAVIEPVIESQDGTGDS